MRSFYLNGARSSTKDPTSFFLYKEILAKMLAALIKGTEKNALKTNGPEYPGHLFSGGPSGIRTRVSALRGRRPRPG